MEDFIADSRKYPYQYHWQHLGILKEREWGVVLDWNSEGDGEGVLDGNSEGRA